LVIAWAASIVNEFSVDRLDIPRIDGRAAASVKGSVATTTFDQGLKLADNDRPITAAAADRALIRRKITPSSVFGARQKYTSSVLMVIATGDDDDDASDGGGGGSPPPFARRASGDNYSSPSWGKEALHKRVSTKTSTPLPPPSTCSPMLAVLVILLQPSTTTNTLLLVSYVHTWR